MADGVLLDWEGLLADTGQARRDSLRAALAAEGLAFDDANYDDRCLGRSVRSAAANALGERAADATLLELVALRAEREFSARIAHGFALERDAARFVDRAQLRTPVVIVTAAGRDETDTALRMAGLHDSCAAVVTADEVGGDAPSRELFEWALTHLARRRPIRRDHVIALATTSPALRAARDAGVRTIAVGAPAHVALEAHAALPFLAGATVDDLDALLGITSERPV
jgi:beta-phosphoglucomutase-like phosphatase (HAD superfamily)